MSWVFQPLTGDLIFVPESGSGSGSDPFSLIFDATSSWGTPSGGTYSISVPESTHGKGVQPAVDVFELEGLVYNEVGISISVSGLGNVTITVSEVPNLRFEGRILIY